MSVSHQILLLFLFLQTKHLIADFIWQTQYELEHKGIYWHQGGQLHAAKHAFMTAMCFWVFTDPVVCLIAYLIDFVAHLHIDWCKSKINTAARWTPSGPGFWWLMGIDQFCHQMTYVFMIWLFIDK
jgi:hypothetical protein